MTPAVSRTGALPALKVSKDELLARAERLERANVTLRSRNKALKRAAKEAADRLAELEREVGRLQRMVQTKAAPTRVGRKPGRRAAMDSKRPGRNSPDAVPPGVAVETPEPERGGDQRVLDELNEKRDPE